MFSATLLLAQLLSGQILPLPQGGQVSAIQTETATLIPTGTWTVDPVHSSIRFDVVDTDSMMKSISGRFTEFEGTVEGGEDQFAKGVVRTSSVLTDNEMR